MTLRRTLLLAFLLLGLLPSAALALLSYVQTRDAMTQQIQQSLTVQAQSIQSDLDQLLFERFQNAMVWRRSELMDDLRFGDVDKRVANYLTGLQQGYGDVYQELDCIGPQGEILASSSPSHIAGSTMAPLEEQVSVRAPFPGAIATLTLPPAHTLGDERPMSVSVPIPSLFKSAGAPHDQLRLLVNRAPLERLLDVAAQDRRVIVVIDQQGHWIVGSKRLRGEALLETMDLARTLAAARAAPSQVIEHSPWLNAAALVGHASSSGSLGFLGSGWTTLVFEPVDEALAPVSHVALAFTGLFALVFVATLVAAAWIASSIARPISHLTRWTRQYQAGNAPPSASTTGSAIVELSLLEDAFDALMKTLDQSRRDLVQTSKMAVLGELGAVLAHEVRTPLGILRSSAQVLKRNAAIGPQGLELIEFIESETERLNRLVSTLLNTAQTPQPLVSPCDLHALLQQCVQMHALKSDASGAASTSTIALELHAANPIVVADAEQLKQVFFNLLSNAAQAAGPAGQVALGTSDTDDTVQVVCEDSGPGVSPALETQIFEPFITRRAGGFGLGLAVVRQIIGAHQGAIHVHKSRWGGAMFTVTMPRDGGILDSTS